MGVSQTEKPWLSPLVTNVLNRMSASSSEEQ